MDNKMTEKDTLVLEKIYEEISSIIKENKEKMVYEINSTLVDTYY